MQNAALPIAFVPPPRHVFVQLKKHDTLRAVQTAASKAGDVAALVASVEGTIKQVADHFGRGLSQDDKEDLYAAGRIGAVVAAQRYDSEDSRGSSFNTFAFFWIRAYVVKEAFFFWGKGRIRFQGETKKIFYGYGQAGRKASACGGDVEASVEEIAEILGVSTKILQSTLSGTTTDISFNGDARSRGASAAEIYTPLQDRLPDPASLDLFETLSDRVELEKLERALGLLDPRECYILRERFFGGKDLEVIARAVRLTSERVRQIVEIGLRHLRELFEVDDPDNE